MDRNERLAVIGYSVFDRFEECYEYNENACYIADSVEAAGRVLRYGNCAPDEGRIDPVTFDDIMNDFGYSLGQYAMEASVFGQFQRLAQAAAVTFTAELYDGDPDLMVVEIAGVQRQED